MKTGPLRHRATLARLSQNHRSNSEASALAIWWETSCCTLRMSPSTRSYVADQRWVWSFAPTKCAVMRTRVCSRRTLPWITKSAFNSLDNSRMDFFAAQRRIVDVPAITPRRLGLSCVSSEIRSSIKPSAKFFERQVSRNSRKEERPISLSRWPMTLASPFPQVRRSGIRGPAASL